MFSYAWIIANCIAPEQFFQDFFIQAQPPERSVHIPGGLFIMSGKELKLISPFGAYSLSQLLGIKISVFNLVTAVDNSILVGLYKLFHSLMIISGLILEVTDSLSQIHACIGVGIKPGCLFVNTPLQAGKVCRNKAQTGM